MFFESHLALSTETTPELCVSFISVWLSLLEKVIDILAKVLYRNPSELSSWVICFAFKGPHSAPSQLNYVTSSDLLGDYNAF